MVLAAGAGRRLESLTDDLPKTLLPVDGDRTILDIALGNLRRAGHGDGRGRHRLRGRARRGAPGGARGAPRRRGSRLVFNPKAEEWNNCYSLWCAREHFARGVLLCNGDTVHPPEVEERLLAGRGHSEPRARARRREGARRGGDEGAARRRRAAARDQQGARPGRRGGRVHRADADRAGGGRRPGRGARGDLAARPRRSTTRTASRSTPTAAGASAWRRSAGSSGSRSTTSADLDRAREVAWRC